MLTLKEKKSDNWQRNYLEKEKRKKEAEKWATLLVTLLLTNKKKKCNFATLEERREKKMQLKMRVFV